MMKIPFNDLRRHHAPIQGRLDRALLEVARSGRYISDEKVAQFESAYASYCEVDHCVAVGSGTAALTMALLALDLPQGAEVITVPNTYVATVEAIIQAGAKPVFVDVNARTHLMDPSLLEAAITSKTAAIIPVHLYGQAAPLSELKEIATRHDLAVIEDSAQAHGARYQGEKVGKGFACFSFYPGKNLGALGEGGAITCDSSSLASRLRSLRNHGQDQKNQHRLIGTNSRMDEMQAAVLLEKLPLLEAWNEKRRQIAHFYDSQFTDLGGVEIPQREQGHVFHVYSLLVRERETLTHSLRQSGVETSCHYPTPIHLQPAYRKLGYSQGDFPQSERIARTTISLPIFPELRESEVRYVTSQVRRLIEKSSPLSPCLHV